MKGEIALNLLHLIFKGGIPNRSPLTHCRMANADGTFNCCRVLSHCLVLFPTLQAVAGHGVVGSTLTLAAAVDCAPNSNTWLDCSGSKEIYLVACGSKATQVSEVRSYLFYQFIQETTTTDR